MSAQKAQNGRQGPESFTQKFYSMKVCDTLFSSLAYLHLFHRVRLSQRPPIVRLVPVPVTAI